MALVESTEIDKIEVVGPHKAVQVRKALVVKKDGVEIARKRIRDVVNIGYLDESNNLVLTDFTQYHQDIQDVIAVAYTDTIKENWKQKLIKDKTDQGL